MIAVAVLLGYDRKSRRIEGAAEELTTIHADYSTTLSGIVKPRIRGRKRPLLAAGIPVMGHIGLTPQSATMLGGFKTQGKTAERALELVNETRELERAGCFSIVLEAVPTAVAARITELLEIPTFGIGAGPGCDGQVLVYHDLLGLTEGHLPRFVKRYANLSAEIRDALTSYAEEVRSGAFPDEEHSYSMGEEELAELEAALNEVSRLRD